MMVVKGGVKSMKSKNSLPLKAVLLAIFCNGVFGLAAPFIKLAYKHFEIGNGNVFDTILFAGVRFFFAGILVFIFTWITHKKFPTFKRENTSNILWLAVVYTFLQYVFFFIGVSNCTGVSVSVMNPSSVFIAVIFAHFAYKDDKLNSRKIIGAIIGFCGVLAASLAGGTMGGFSFFGEGFVIITAICFVVGSMINRKASKVDDSFITASYNLLIGSTMLIIFGLIGGGRLNNININGVLTLSLLIVSAALGFTLWSYLTRNYPLGKISIFNFINPVTGVIISALVLGENALRWQYMLALVLVSVGIVIVNYKTE